MLILRPPLLTAGKGDPERASDFHKSLPAGPQPLVQGSWKVLPTQWQEAANSVWVLSWARFGELFWEFVLTCTY